MSKPLGLTIYPKSTGRHGESVYVDESGEWSYRESDCDGYAANKHLTDAELSAELFRQTSWLGAIGRTYATDEGRNIVIEAAFTFGPVTRDEYEWLTLSQFATLPHYDEVDQ
jgi:hypothetical protein